MTVRVGKKSMLIHPLAYVNIFGSNFSISRISERRVYDLFLPILPISNIRNRVETLTILRNTVLFAITYHMRILTASLFYSSIID